MENPYTEKTKNTPTSSETSGWGDPYTQAQPMKTSKPLIAGILLIFAGFLGFITWLSIFTIDPSLVVIPRTEVPITIDQMRSFIQICSIIGCVLSVFTVLGGILAIRRKMWWIAMFGAVFGLFTGVIYIVTLSIFSVIGLMPIIGLILLVTSRKEF